MTDDLVKFLAGVNALDDNTEYIIIFFRKNWAFWIGPNRPISVRDFKEWATHTGQFAHHKPDT